MSDQTIPIRRPSVVPVNTDVSQKMSDTKYPTELIPLPTKGWFYPENHPLSSGEVEVKQMTAREEDILANQDLIKKGKALDRLLESLLVDKSIKIEEVLAPDKDAIFIAIRRLAYGNEYNVSLNCPNCNHTNKVAINLSTLDYKPFDFDKCPKGQNSFEYTLPSGTVVTYKILNQIDELSIDAELAQLKKISKESSKELTTRMVYLITSVNGISDKLQIRKFVNDTMPAKDSLALRKHIRENSPNVDLTFTFVCSECSDERRLAVPMGASFLWPDLES